MSVLETGALPIEPRPYMIDRGRRIPDSPPPSRVERFLAATWPASKRFAVQLPRGPNLFIVSKGAKTPI